MSHLGKLGVVLLASGWAAAIGQSTPPDEGGPTAARRASPGANQPPPHSTVLRYHVFFAWDPNRMPSLDDGVTMAIGDTIAREVRTRLAGPGGALVGANSPGTYEIKRVSLSEMPPVSDRPRFDERMPEAPRIGAGWKACQITVSVSRPEVAPRGMDALNQKRLESLEIPRMIHDRVWSWLDTVDSIDGRSKHLYDRIEWDRKVAQDGLKQWRFPELIGEVMRQQRESELALTSKQARLQALDVRIHDVSAKAQDKVDQDPLLRQLRVIAQMREDAQRLLEQAITKEKDAGRAISPDQEARLKDAQMKALESKVQIAQREEAVVAAAGGELLSRLAAEQAMLSIDLAELRAKRDGLEKAFGALVSDREKWESHVKYASARLDAVRPYVVPPVR